MDVINMLPGGFPTTTKTWNFLRDSVKTVVESISLMAGDSPIILEGVVELNGAVSDGIILFKREIFPFKASALQNTVTIKEEIEQVSYNEDLDSDLVLDLKEGYVKRFAECGVGGVDSFLFSDLKRVRSLQNTRILGETMPWAGILSKIPEGWLQAAGQTLNTADYPELFNTLGYSHGGVGATFKLPNLINRSAVGAGGDYTLGNVGGEKEHAITIGEMPSHNHGGNTSSSGSHTHNISLKKGENDGGDVGKDLRKVTDPGEVANVVTDSAGSHTHQISNQGSNEAHNNMQPYTAVNYIIYVGI